MRRLTSAARVLRALLFSQAAAQYEVEMLHPAGLPRSFGWGAGDGQQVG
ncbi:MAG: hypothetical protein H0W86_06140 [Armatimonadetes bacterium]|nr:hypothetical protein [Armatimonadota bacterium]